MALHAINAVINAAVGIGASTFMMRKFQKAFAHEEKASDAVQARLPASPTGKVDLLNRCTSPTTLPTAKKTESAFEHRRH